MNKQQELAALDAFIATLPADTYLRLWLSQVRHEVESCLHSDIFPEVSLKETGERMQKIIRDANANADCIKSNAVRHCESITHHHKALAAKVVKEAETYANSIRRDIRADVNRLSTALLAVA